MGEETIDERRAANTARILDELKNAVGYFATVGDSIDEMKMKVDSAIVRINDAIERLEGGERTSCQTLR